VKENQKIDVCFATPSLDMRVCLEYKRSLSQTEWLLWNAGYVTAHMDRGGDCFVQKVRSKLATDFLRNFPDTDNFFFLDDDIGWPAEKAMEFIRSDKDVIAGIYPKKSEELDFPVALAADPITGELIEQNGLLFAKSVPTGFMRIKRRVLEKIAETSVNFMDFDIENGVGVGKQYHYLFECGPGPDGWFWGEDFSFCQKVLNAGFEIWVDPNIKFDHRGHRKWTNTLSDHLDKFRERAKEQILKAA
jgi:hypothetical protein